MDGGKIGLDFELLTAIDTENQFLVSTDSRSCAGRSTGTPQCPKWIRSRIARPFR